LLDRVRNFENEQFANKKSNYQAPRLEPVNDSGGTMLLREVEYFLLLVLFIRHAVKASRKGD